MKPFRRKPTYLPRLPFEYGMTSEEYAALVAQRGKQTWTKADEERLAAKVLRIARQTPGMSVR